MAHGNGRRPGLNPDEVRQKYAKHDRMTQRALDEARVPVSSHPPGSEPYRADLDSVSEVTVGRDGLKVKAKSPWVTVVLAGFALVAFVAWLWMRR
jgi:hypothetical protein